MSGFMFLKLDIKQYYEKKKPSRYHIFLIYGFFNNRFSYGSSAERHY